MGAADYWTQRYESQEGAEHHSRQNDQISRDFLRHARMRKPFADALSLTPIIEIGCGTGELAALVKALYQTDAYYATDFSRAAIREAQRRHAEINFWIFDVLKDKPFQAFSLAISSNTLEHFIDPWKVIDRMFKLAPLVMLLVPYQQPITDHYESEGGAGHVVEFTEESFDPYVLIDSFTFETRGWQHSSAGEKPLQLAVLLEA